MKKVWYHSDELFEIVIKTLSSTELAQLENDCEECECAGHSNQEIKREVKKVMKEALKNHKEKK